MADRTPGRSARQRKRRTAARVIVYTIGGMLAYLAGHRHRASRAVVVPPAALGARGEGEAEGRQ